MSKVKKYAFVGSHGTGKSSSSTYFASLLKKDDRKRSVKVIEENVRELSKLFNNKMNTPEFQKLCMIDHLHREMTAEQIHNTIVCDRTALDTLIYGTIYKIKLPAEYFSLAINHLNSFSKIFFVRINKEEANIIDDGFRDTDMEVRQLIDEQFERFLKLWGGDYIEINSKDIFTFPYLESINNE